MNITAELLAKIEAWKQAGDRCVELKTDRNDDKWNIWLYDYSVAAGVYLKEEGVYKDWDVLIISNKRLRLLDELKSLDKKLGGVA
jgi:hypothetical protein